MQYRDLREFLSFLESKQQLKRITQPLSPYLEITEVCDRTLNKEGPALLFEHPISSSVPLLGNLFGTPKRVALAMGREEVSELREVGKLLAMLKEPEPPKGFKDLFNKWPLLKQVLTMQPDVISTKKAPCFENTVTGSEVDLTQFPIQTCWPGDAAPLLTWGLVITKGPKQIRQNLGIYRQQLLAKNKLIMRWLPHRGGALDYQDWCKEHPKEPFPVAVALGADPATTLAAVTPIPDTISEYSFAGLLRGNKTETTYLPECATELMVPSSSEIILSGHIYPNDVALEGPFGDHTGYYNEQETFPVFTVETIYHRDNPIYHSTYTGKPPDEPAILGVALNEVFVPILQKQFPEIIDFYLPPEGCSYRLAVVSIHKQYPGHAKRILFGIWSFLRQFMYTKWIVVVDADVNIRDWKEVIWAITTRMDPIRDTVMVDNTPIDYLDFASPVSGLGSKMGFDATNKWKGETIREWGIPIIQKEEIVNKIDALWKDLNII